MKAKVSKASRMTVAARVAGEDIHHGDYVTVLNTIVELPSFLWCCSAETLPADEPVRMCYMPENAGEPYQVVSVCLPFVYVRRPNGDLRTVDTRKVQLVRLSPESGRRVWKHMRNRCQKRRT